MRLYTIHVSNVQKNTKYRPFLRNYFEGFHHINGPRDISYTKAKVNNITVAFVD